MTLANNKFFRLFMVILAFLLCLSFFALTPSASAFETPVAYSSAYINSTTVSPTAGSGGAISIAYSITGTGVMDQIGTTGVDLYENGVLIKTYSGVMVSSTYIYTGSITYSGTVGKSYYAFVGFKASKGGGSDNYSMQTTTVTAKN